MKAVRRLKEKLTLMRLTLLAGLIPALFFLVFVAGEAVGELLEGKSNVIPFLALLLLLLSGYLLAWFRARAGGLMMIAGSLGLGLYLLFLSGFNSFSVFFFYSVPFLLIGSIVLILYRLKKI